MLKLFELNSIRHRMFSGFLFLTLLIFLLGSWSVYQLDNVSRVGDVHRQLNQLQIFTLNLLKTDNDFFDFEVTNETYFRTRASSLLTKRDSLSTLLASGIAAASRATAQNGYPFRTHLLAIDSLTQLYNKGFAELEILIWERGYKEAGIEGKMRSHAHALENPELNIPLVNVLSLRRHEKDFLLRHDSVYLVQFAEKAGQMKQTLQEDSIQNAIALYHLHEYIKLFGERVQIEREIGFTSNSGLRHDLNLLTDQLSQHFFELTRFSEAFYFDLRNSSRIYYIIITASALVFSIITGLWLSRRLSEPISKLSRLANSATLPYAAKFNDFQLSHAANEINTLTSSFIKLMNHTNHQMREIEDKSKKLEAQNRELNKLNKELDHFLYSAAHDLRSPLASLLGIVRVMKFENKQPDLVPYMEMMTGSIERQEVFIAQIVNYAKNKKLNIQPEEIDLEKLITEIFQNNEFLPGSAAIEKHIRIHGDVPFYSDKSRIQIIFNNLISNSIRYADARKSNRNIDINLSITESEATIEFQDNGVGIGPEHVTKIFDMFYRANFDSKGSGLGLFILQEAVHKLAGQVSVESELGLGTKFLVHLPNRLPHTQELVSESHEVA